MSERTSEIQATLPPPRPATPDARALAQSKRAPLRGLRSLVVLPGLLTALLLWLCYFPAAWGWLAWVALVPLFTLVRRPASRRELFLGAWAGGLLFFFAALQWLRVADPRMYLTWIGLTVYCSLYVPLAIGLARYLDARTRWPLVITLPVLWTALEYLRAYLITGFPWYFIAHTQHDFALLLQIADTTGAYGVTFLVVAVNVVVFEWLSRWRPFAELFGLPTAKPGARPLVVSSALVALLVAAALGYGFWRLNDVDFAEGPRVALVQSNVPQEVRNAGTDEADEFLLRHNSRLTDRALLMRPDLIVWPETSYPGYWVEVAPEVSRDRVPVDFVRAEEESQENARLRRKRWPVPLLLGMNSEIMGRDERRRLYNSAVLLVPGTADVPRYNKIHRVPFGEYVPLRDWLPFMNYFAPYDFDYSTAAGEQFTRFPLGAYRFGVVICYEDSDPGLAREYVNGSASDGPVDFLINISNDGWFKGTSEHEEHLAICRFRAVECRRAVVRAVNMGVSAVIDGNGRVLPPVVFRRDDDMTFWGIGDAKGSLPVSHWEEFKSVAGVLAAKVPIDRRSSFYAHWGDWLPWTCWAWLVLSLVWARFVPRSTQE
ncbi:hypothetical protein AYO44_03200 [Planctomycetaceae bacterium SCGC AG-212-F19]|nr:hypothetical protein AYO44_03200 [Planctomycetaceae bacterium SCGC AG-212-F19]